MSSLRISTITVVLSFCALFGFGQGEVPVDMFTGTPSISVPLWTVVDHDLSVPVALSYNASGLKLEDKAHFVGLGWTVVGGGSISREVRGLPDDFNGIAEAFQNNTNYDNRRGWLFPKVSSSTVIAKDVGDFVPSSDNSTSTCDEATDYAKMASWNLYSDTEPDIFSINAPGLFASFVFDNSVTPQIRFLGIEDLSIQMTQDGGTNDITSFTVTNASGIIYKFHASAAEERAHKDTTNNITSFLFTEYSLYRYNIPNTTYKGNVKFNRQWVLSTIESPSGAKISFSYTPKSYTISDPVDVGMRNVADTGFDTKTLFTRKVTTHYQILNSITSSTGEKVEFAYPYDFIESNDILTSITITDSRRADPFVKEYIFNHVNIYGGYTRSFLESIQERSYCDVLPPYKFSYNGVNFTTQSSALPAPTSHAKDFWGYYNGKTSNTHPFPTLYVYPLLDYPNRVRIDRISGYVGTEYILTGADRTPDANSIKIGTLDVIKYPWGGQINIVYEPHTYLDPYNNQTFLGGGLRVKSIKYHDGLNTAADIFKEFVYEQSTGVSSGRVINKPVLYFPTQKYRNGATEYTYEYLSALGGSHIWNRLLVRSDEDILRPEYVRGSLVGYTSVTVKRPGAGSAKHLFAFPGSFNTASSGDWIPATQKFARNSLCETMGILSTTGAWRFPYPQNPNYDYERGLPVTTYEYDEAGVAVRETTNTYQTLYRTGTSPVKVWGVRMEAYPNASDTYMFGKYFLLTGVAKAASTQTVKVLRPDNTGLTTTSEYFHEGTAHKYLTRTRVTNSDGTVYSTKVKYPQDYLTVTGTADVPSQMIGYMQTNKWNSIPVEIIRKVQRPGESEKVMGASLTKFNPFSAGKPLVHQSLQLSIANPITDFSESVITSGTTKTFTNDSRYEVVSQVNAYDATYLQPVTVESPISRNIASTVFGFNKSIPVAQFSEATLPQVAFSDFETASDVEFSRSSSNYGDGRTGSKAVQASVKLSRTISKAATSNYILSMWVKTDASAFTVNYTIKNTSLTQLATGTISVPAANQKFVFVEKKIAVTSFPATFILEVQGALTQDSPTTLLIDDIAFYPEQAMVSSTTYDLPFGVNSATDASSLTSYTSYDHLGRGKLVFDQDKNIIRRNSYNHSLVADQLTAEFSLPPTQYGTHSYLLNSVATFVAWEDCHENVTYEWDLGTGTFVVGGKTATKTFTSAAPHIIRLKVTSPGYAAVTVSKTILINPSFTICAKGVSTFNLTTQTANSDPPPYTCSEISATPLSKQTIFRVTSLYELPPSWTYKWYIRPIGSDTWVGTPKPNLPATGPEHTITVTTQSSPGFEIMCEATTGQLPARSNVIKVVLTN